MQYTRQKLYEDTQMAKTPSSVQKQVDNKIPLFSSLSCKVIIRHYIKYEAYNYDEKMFITSL